MMAARRTQARGQTLPLFAILVPGMLALMALGLDAAQIFLERRDAQGAADLAAVAGAKQLPASDVNAEAEAEAVGIANGYTAAEVKPNAAYGSPGQIEVVIDTEVDTFFMNVLSFFGGGSYDKVAVSARAVAQNDPGVTGAGPGAIFAGGDNCTGGKYGVDVSGSNQEVYGGVHSNADANVGGGSNDFTETTTPDIDDPWTYVGTLKSGSTGNGNTYQAGYPQDVGPTALPWPAGWAPADVGSGGTPPPPGSFLRAYYDLADANGTRFSGKVDSITKDGVYYTTSTDGMDISSITGSVRNVVLVAPHGPIKISASSKTFNPYQNASLPRQGMLMLSGMTYSGIERCDKYTIAVSGSSSTWNGVMWAPGGLVEMSGSSNTAVNGSLIGWAVRLNGSDLVIRYDATLFQGDPTVLIVE